MKVFGWEVPQRVFDELCARLDKGPATAADLENIIHDKCGVPWMTTMRLVDRWVQKQRKAGYIETVNRRWQMAARTAPEPIAAEGREKQP